MLSDILTLPFSDGSAEFVRLDHVLEHLPQRTACRAVLEAARVLAPGGQLRIGLPDIGATFRSYLETEDLGERLLVLRTVYGSQTHPGEFHQSGWDAESLRSLLTACGFVDVVVAPEEDEEDWVRVEGVNLVATAVKSC